MPLTISEELILRRALETAKRLAKDVGTDEEIAEIEAAYSWYENQPILPDDYAPPATMFMLDWCDKKRSAELEANGGVATWFTGQISEHGAG